MKWTRLIKSNNEEIYVIKKDGEYSNNLIYSKKDLKEHLFNFLEHMYSNSYEDEHIKKSEDEQAIWADVNKIVEEVERKGFSTNLPEDYYVKTVSNMNNM